MTPAEALKQIEEDAKQVINALYDYGTEQHSMRTVDALARLVAWAKKGVERG